MSKTVSKLSLTRAVVGCAVLMCLAVAGGCAVRMAKHRLPEVYLLPEQPDLPDPLVQLDGLRILTAEQWQHQRRPELKALFAHYMYGPIPPKPAHTKVQILGEYRDFLGGKATLRLISLKADSPPPRMPKGSESGVLSSVAETVPVWGQQILPPSAQSPQIDLMLVVPNNRATPAPVLLAMDFSGNHALTSDARVPLAHSWMGDFCIGCVDHKATEAARGTEASGWPLEAMVARGYALAAFYSGDVDSDRKDVSDGLYAWLADGDPSRNNPTNRGTLAAWAWGFQRCVDYLVSDQNIDSKRIAAVGHSRNGKAALLAAAYDERISMVIPHQAGCGGTAPSRGKTNGTTNRFETIRDINTTFPHWFNAQFKEFNTSPERLPFDQNCLLALCAPRPVLVSAAEADYWSNPIGQFETALAADPVYRLLGGRGLDYYAFLPRGIPTRSLPPTGQLIASRLGFYLRAGEHSMTADDWRVFMDFADRQWGRP
jgi:hypothetical protein